MVTRPRNLPQADPYFDSVVLLAPFSGEDGDTSSTDLSNSAHTLTFVGTAALDGDIRKFGFTSLLLDGNSDYVTAPDNADWEFGSNDFTIEFHYRFNNTIDDMFISKWSNTTSERGWYFGWVNSIDSFDFIFYTPGGIQRIGLRYAFVPTLNQWYHIAICRESGTLRLFIDGVLVDTDSTYSADSIRDTTSLLHIGALFSNSNFYSDGQFENVRITNGVARYSATFTPPERAYPTVQNLVPTDPNFDSVVLLLPFDGADAATTTTDLSNEGHTMTFAANASLDSDIRKFGSTSCFFDDTINGKGVYTTTNAAWANLKIADGFTVEAHVNYSQNPTNTLVSMWSWTQGSTTRSWGVFLGSDGAIIIYVQDSASTLTQNFTTASSLLTASIWHHVVFQCQPAGNFEVFVDGTRVANVTPTITELRDPTDDFCVGATDDSVDELGGHVDNVRITKGIARYTDGFTPPTAPHPTS